VDCGGLAPFGLCDRCKLLNLEFARLSNTLSLHVYQLLCPLLFPLYSTLCYFLIANYAKKKHLKKNKYIQIETLAKYYQVNSTRFVPACHKLATFD